MKTPNRHGPTEISSVIRLAMLKAEQRHDGFRAMVRGNIGHRHILPAHPGAWLGEHLEKATGRLLEKWRAWYSMASCPAVEGQQPPMNVTRG